jgi:methylated-DNA-protein-cysteine methyltransferase-like protein
MPDVGAHSGPLKDTKVPTSILHGDRDATVPKAAPWPDDHVLTPFQSAVVDVVDGLRPGDLATYGEIAEEAGYPGSAQAVGNVIRGAPELPWWRVVPSDGRLYRTHLRTQQPLLEAEGHRIDRNRRIHAAEQGRPT